MSVEVKLQYPVEWGDGVTVTSLRFRRLKAKDIRDMKDDSSLEDVLKIASRVCMNEEALTPAFFMELDAVDAMNVGEAIGDFLSSGQKTGPKP